MPHEEKYELQLTIRFRQIRVLLYREKAKQWKDPYFAIAGD